MIIYYNDFNYLLFVSAPGFRLKTGGEIAPHQEGRRGSNFSEFLQAHGHDNVEEVRLAFAAKYCWADLVVESHI